MKPLSLEITGLNSFRRKQVIEFGALLEDGLFGIFGPTGSGKSSILDAITLALYGKVKRAQGGKGGIINVREKTCAVRFSFEIDADGGRRRYSIERVLARASGRSEGVQTRRARLIEHDGEREIPIAEKQSEIDELILELIGIQYDEFMRAVVLPQGAFADFLGLKPKDRAGVLQRLFGLQELGIRLSSRLKAQADEMRMTRAGIEGRLAELRACDDEAVVAAESLYRDAAVSEEVARASKRDSDAALESAEALAALLLERAALREREADREAVEAELAELRRSLERSDRAGAIATALDALELALARFDESDRNWSAAIDARDAAATTLGATRERFEAADLAHRADHDRLTDEITRLEAIARDMAELERARLEAETAERDRRDLRGELDTLETSRQALRAEVERSTVAISQNESRIRSVEVSREEHDLLSRLQLVTERLRARERSHAERATIVGDLESEIATLSEQRAATQQEELAAGASLHSAKSELQLQRGAVEAQDRERTSIAERYRRLTSVLEMVEQLEAQCRDHEEACAGYRAVIEEQDTQWTVLGHTLHGISERHMALQVEREELAERLQEAYRRDALAVLAPQLRDGEACPLCGSLEHPRHAEHPAGGGTSEIAALEAQLRTLETQVTDARNRLDKCSQNMEKNRTTRSMSLASLERSEQTLVAVRAKIDETIAAAGEQLPLASAEEVRRYLEEIAARGTQARALLDAAKLRRDELEEQIPTIERIVNEHRLRAAEIETSIRNKREQQLDARNAVTVLESEIAELRSSIARESGGLTPEQIESELERMRENDRAAQHLREVIANEGKKLAVVREELETLDRSIGELSQRHAAAASLAAHILAEIEKGRATLELRLAAILAASESELPLEDLIASRTLRRDRLAWERTESEARYTEAVGNEKLCRQAVEHCASLRARDEADRDRIDRDCRAALAIAGFATVEEAREARLDEDERESVRERIAAAEEELRSLAVRIAEVDRAIAGRTLEEAELAAAREAAVSAARQLEEAIGATAAARQELERLRERNVEFHRFSSENAGALERERTIEQLGRYLQGDAFINFLADERLADVCRRATRTLEELTGGRYEILSRPDEGFLVRDMGNGGVERSPGSLSGGETFVVSLALALALSDTIQMGRAPLEFFFLDEGFGTLDAELLDTVVDTLERLRSRRRTIGLITHVTTLRERVPRRLIVTPPTDGLGTAVKYEVA